MTIGYENYIYYFAYDMLLNIQQGLIKENKTKWHQSHPLSCILVLIECGLV